MRLTVLTENTACREGVQAEHGLSLYIETAGRRILFDMGQSRAFWDNAKALGIDLEQADLAVISHGHYDHGGGLGTFLENNRHAKVYVNQNAFAPHHNAAGKDIGLDPELWRHPRVVPVSGGQDLGEGLCLASLDTPPEDPAGQTMYQQGRFVPEDFRHEQYLLLEEQGRKILVSGCSHKGIRSIMKAFRPDICIGGFHFMKITDEKILETAAWELAAYGAAYYTGHCTGAEQYRQLKAVLGDRLHPLTTGAVYEL